MFNLYIRVLISIFFSFTFLYAVNPVTIGESVDGRSVNAYIYGDGKEVTVIIGSFYGDDSVAIGIADRVIDSIDDKSLIVPEGKKLIIIPVVNPDGVASKMRFNSNGVDLNANFLCDQWVENYYYYSSIVNCGSEPFSERESIVLRNFIESLVVQGDDLIVLSLHSNEDLDFIENNFFTDNRFFANFLDDKLLYKGRDYIAGGDFVSWSREFCEGVGSNLTFLTNDADEGAGYLLLLLKELLSLEFDGIKLSYNDKIMTKIEVFELLPAFVRENLDTEEKVENFISLFRMISKDLEYLLLVNKKFHLDSDYIPQGLIQIDDKLPTARSGMFIRLSIFDELAMMIENAKSKNVNLRIISSYRSFETQQDVFYRWKNIYGFASASRFSAFPGASQHQLGTTIDFNSFEQEFDQTPEGEWLYDNSYKYGFVLSYPKDSEDLTGYIYEPWHFRYIGREAAYIVYHYFDNYLEYFLRWYWFIRGN